MSLCVCVCVCSKKDDVIYRQTKILSSSSVGQQRAPRAVCHTGLMSADCESVTASESE